MSQQPNNWSEAVERAEFTGRANWVFDRSRQTWKALEYSSVYLALIAMAEVLIVSKLFSLPSSFAPIVAGLTTFAIYANDRIVDIEHDAASNPRRTAFIARYQRGLYALAALAYGVAVALSSLGGPAALAITLLPGITWALYALNVVSHLSTSIGRLKDILIVNSLLVAVAWSLTIVFLPLSFANTQFQAGVLLLFVYFVLGTFINTEISNLKDIESDTRAGVATLPVVLGVRRARQSLYIVALSMFLVLGYGGISGYYSISTVAILAAGVVSLIGVIGAIGRVKAEARLPIAAECTRLPILALLVGQNFVM